MNLLAEIERLYTEQPQGRCFLEDLAVHVRCGYVWSSPSCVVLARLVHTSWPHEWLSDPERSLPVTESNCWFVWLGVGRLAEFFEVMPFRQQFACFARRDTARFWPLERLESLCTAKHSPSVCFHPPALATPSIATSPL